MSWKFGANPCISLGCGTPTSFMPVADTDAARTAQGTTIIPDFVGCVKVL